MYYAYRVLLLSGNKWMPLFISVVRHFLHAVYVTASSRVPLVARLDARLSWNCGRRQVPHHRRICGPYGEDVRQLLGMPRTGLLGPCHANSALEIWHAGSAACDISIAASMTFLVRSCLFAAVDTR